MKNRITHFFLLILTLPIGWGELKSQPTMSDEEIDQLYGAAAVERGARSQHEALADYAQEIRFSVRKSPTEAIPFLGKVLMKVSKRNIFQVSEAPTVYSCAQMALLSIPGHAEYFGNQVKAARTASVLENERTGGKPRWGEYDDARSAAVETLTHLPSPESVDVLVELLADTEETGEPTTADHQPDSFGPPSNAILATNALEQLIENPPPPEFMDVYDRGLILAWQHWHERIKAGKQTFRFKGNPTEYDHNGPASKEKLQRIVHDLQRDSERVAGHPKVASESGVTASAPLIRQPPTVAGIFAAFTLLAATAWYFLRSRKLRRKR
jgi:hypothetical protein